MRANHVKRTLAAGGVAIGTMMFEFDSPGIGRIASLAGADFVIFDMEHSGWSDETVKWLIASTRAAEVVPMVRVPSTQYHLLSRPLDIGAMGLMVPMVEDEAQARVIVQSSKYPPTGVRGAGFSLAHDDFEGGNVARRCRAPTTRGS
jgi:2-keto-3-deoxy-L-rhamnonate aldolase RhmA